ncbi:hypothetical protein C496_11203 [Natronorubrum tibetense GA33]|uniref:Uncharacterized protein n=2 Tax=Natronorubrum tibetense TaxID=63128 RepID=L9VU58_9EURY|nr:hypothetical protein C496_11203 [Natronorubrum tibetense GA33]
MGAVAGCLSSSSPEPRAVDMYYPEPRVVDVDSEHQSGDRYDFTVEIENTGASGDVGTTLVWMDDQNDDPYDASTDAETSSERYFDADERREVTVTEEQPTDQEAYGFRVWAAEIGVEIENEGDDGRVDVRLLDGSEVVDDAELRLDADETTTFEFESDYAEAHPEELEIEVEAIE